MEQGDREDEVRYSKDQEQEKPKKLHETVHNAQERRNFWQNSRDIKQGKREKAKDQK